MTTSRGKRARRTAGLAAILASALVLASEGSGSVPTECRDVTCAKTITVADATTVRWVSPEVFYPANEVVYAGLATNRGPLTLVRSYGKGPCRHRFFGSGTSVTVKACGQRTPVRVVAARVKRGSRDLTITYSASPAFDGSAEPPSSWTAMVPLTAP